MRPGEHFARLRRRARLRRMLRLYAAFLRGFMRSLFEPKLEHYAASLSFSTLFSIVPLMAIMIAVFTALPQFEQLRAAFEALLRNSLPLDDPAFIMRHLDRFVANTGQLGLLGVGWMALAAWFFSRTLDDIVQDVCNAPRRGPLAALFTYAGLALAVPLMAALAHAVHGWLAALPAAWGLPVPELLQAVLSWLLSLLLAWSIFWLFYQFAPNRRMAPAATATAAFIVALVWVLSRDAFLYYATHSSTYTTIYGVIATLILLLWWIYISWAILVHGLRFCMLLQQGGAEVPEAQSAVES